MTTIHLTTSTGRSPMRPGLLFIPLALFLALTGLAGTARAAIPPPVCPGPDCRKVFTFYNNTQGPIFPVIQAGIQNPDPWLQALFKDNTKTYAETHYSRVYVNPKNGIPPGSHVSVTVPWYSKLRNDTDTYVDWYNGCRVAFFDSAAALNAAHKQDKNTPVSLAANSPMVSCDTCELPLTIYKDVSGKDGASVAFPAEIPFQLVEYTFADVDTPAGKIPFVKDLNVGYNVSYLDQIYLPVALAPCRTEPCRSDGQDRSAVGYLGTIQALHVFRPILTRFSNGEGWPRYFDPLDVPARPRLPGAYNLLIDQVNVIEKHEKSKLTPSGQSVKDLIEQWKTCTSKQANMTNCPQYEFYKEMDRFFRANYALYNKQPKPAQCTQGPLYYPVPKMLNDLNIMPYVYGWVPFNSGCSAAFNPLEKVKDKDPLFNKALYDYIHQLQYNYRKIDVKQPKQRFNPFVDLVHGQLDANGYAFSVDDAVSYQNHPGDGLIITIGGKKGLPNDLPVVQPPDYEKDFLVRMGDSKAKNGRERPLWKSFGVCKDVADTNFPPLPKDAKIDTPAIIVDTSVNNKMPCTITVTDALNRKYQFTVKMKVPWPKYTSKPPPDSRVVACVGGSAAWCNQISEVATQGPPPKFDLLTPPPLEKP